MRPSKGREALGSHIIIGEWSFLISHGVSLWRRQAAAWWRSSCKATGRCSPRSPRLAPVMASAKADQPGARELADMLKVKPQYDAQEGQRERESTVGMTGTWWRS